MSARRTGLVALAVAALAGSVPPSPAAGQSLLAAGGLGISMDPVDARGRAMGAVGPGMFGTAVVPGDPGASLDLVVPTIAFSFQSSWLSVAHAAGTATDEQGSRLPALGIAYPLRRWGVLSLTLGSMLDQRWTLDRTRALPLDAGGADVTVKDHFVSDGGVAAVRLGFARRMTSKVGVAGAVGLMTGSVTRSYTRSFDSVTATVPLESFTSNGKWGYSGLTGTLGVVLDLERVLRAAGSVTLSGKLQAEPATGSAAPGKEYDMPVELRGGISGTLAPGLTAMVSASYADWSSAGDALDPGESVAGVATGLGAGIELDRGSLFGRTLPLRVGWHHATLPFGFDGGQGTETSFLGGAGMYLVRSGAIPLAEIDLAVEKGSRSAGSFTEDFWRTTLSLRVAGF